MAPVYSLDSGVWRGKRVARLYAVVQRDRGGWEQGAAHVHYEGVTARMF